MPAAPRQPRTLVFGVLGGVAAGKTAVAERLAGPDGQVLSADELVQEALDTPALQAHLRAAFGPGAVAADGRTDRELVARAVFADAGRRRDLEGWIHPIVRARILADLDEARRRGVPRVVLDVPLLLENDAQHGLASLCDHLILVEVDPEQRDRRAVLSRGWEPGEVARRDAAQMPLDQKRARADFVVRNEGALEDLNAAVDEILAETGAA